MSRMINLGLGLILFYAVALPWQISYNILPVPTYTNEFIAISGWGLLLLVVARVLIRRPQHSAALPYLVAFYSLLILTVMVQSVSRFGAIFGITALWIFFLGVAGACAYAGYTIAASPDLNRFADLFSAAWVLGGLLSVGAELVQYLGLDFSWYVVAPLSEPGRAYGNIRQPNHLVTLLGIAMVCVVWLRARGQVQKFTAALLVLLLGLGILLTGSKTGLVILVGLFVWMLIRLPSGMDRRLIWMAPVCTALILYLLFSLDSLGAFSYVGRGRIEAYLGGISDPSGMRFELWRNSLELIRTNWLLGTGFGQFQFYYLLSDLPQPSKTLFTNAHSLPLQVAVEFGIPITTVLFYLLARAGWAARHGFKSTLGQCCVAAVAVVAVHSISEFPLWYAYFLLPTSFFLGVLAGLSPDTEKPGVLVAAGAERSKFLAWAGLLTIALLITAVPHYMSLAAIYAPGGNKDSLGVRLETAQKGFIYRHWILFTVLAAYPYAQSEKIVLLADLYDSNARFFMNDEYLLRYAIVLALTGRLDEAKRVASALKSLDSDAIFRLKSYCESHPNSELKTLAAYIDNPGSAPVSAAGFRVR